MSEYTSPPPVENPRGPVIRRLEAAHETAQERLMKKHLPAWVISGAVNVGIIALLMLIFNDRGATAKPPEQVVATSVEKAEDPPQENLTNEDLGLQADLEAALPELTRIDKATVDAAETNDTLGQPDAPELDTTALAVPGLNVAEFTTGGVTGDAGNVLKGDGGAAGLMVGASFPGRSGATKTRLLKEGGGNKESEAAVARGLAWLARQQKPDGSWVYDGNDKDEVVAATGMALLPFLAAGETHKSGKKYQKTVMQGLNFLLRSCPLTGANPGKFTGAGNMYAQAIGSLALCEAFGMTKDRLLLAGAQASINYIQRAQAANGSWGYQSGSAGDTSIVGWQVQALSAARLSKEIVVSPQVFKKAIDFLDFAGGGSRKAMYGYTDSARAAPGTSLTAVGLLSRYYIDKNWGPENAGMAEGVKGLMARAPAGTTKQPRTSKPSLDMYYYYYATQVVHFYEGDEWKDWNEGPKGADGTRKDGMRDWLISIQNRKDGANQGSWEPDGGFIGRQCGRVGTTSLCLLTLEVYYRHLPLYKRGQHGAALKIIDGG